MELPGVVRYVMLKPRALGWTPGWWEQFLAALELCTPTEREPRLGVPSQTPSPLRVSAPEGVKQEKRRKKKELPPSPL